MNFGDALWMLEASFNYNNCFSEDDCDYSQSDSVYVPVNYGSFDEIPMAELQSLYVSVKNKLSVIYNAFNVSNKGVLFLDFELEATPNGNQLFINMVLGSFNNQKSGITVTTTNPFGPTDYWFPGSEDGDPPLGKCEDYIGQYKGVSDAQIELNKAIIRNKGDRPNKLYYFVSYRKYEGYNQREYLFRLLTHHCIQPHMMNYYYQIYVGEVNDLRDYCNIAPSRSLIYVDTRCKWIPSVHDYDLSEMYFTGFTMATKKTRKLPVNDQVPFSL